MKQTILLIVLAYLAIGTYAQDDLDAALDKKFKKIYGDDYKDKIINKNADNKPGDKTCECVSYYLCSKNNEIITDGKGLLDIRESSECDSYLEVCCNGNKTEGPIAPTPEPKRGCGYRNPKGVDFTIIGEKDDEAQFGEFPWMAAVLAEEFNVNINSVLNVYKCGGALIHPQAVVTAAHCVSDKKTYKIRVGEWDTQTTKEPYPHQDRAVKSIVIHEKYKAGPEINDIAILFLESPVNIDKTVNTLCMPAQDVVIPSGTKCFASGWGKNEFGKEGTYQVILKKRELPMVDHHTCQEKLRTTRLGHHFNLDKSFVCAGGEKGKDTCKGDGGSPLVCPIPGHEERYQHVGIVAWGIGCNDPIPAVYVNVAMFRHWIDQQITSHKLDTSNYEY